MLCIPYTTMNLPSSSTTDSSSAATASTSATNPPTALPLLIPSLPNDLAMNCLARSPRSHHVILSLVSRAFRSLLCSSLFYSSRSLLHSAEPVLYLSLRSTNPSLLWFTLIQNPNSLKYSLIPVPPLPSPPCIGSAFVSLGPKIYVIGGSIKDIASPKVWALDCRFNTWESIPSMRVGREFAAAGVVDGKIYVFGGCLVDTWARSKHWAEVYDPKKQQWESIDSNNSNNSSFYLFREKWMHASAVINDRIYAMADRNGVVYEPRRGRWEEVESELDLGWRGRGCVIDGVLYCYDYLGKIRGFDVERGEWRDLKGLEKGLPRFLCGATMANFGGKLMVVWEGKEGKGKGGDVDIWCAEISVEKKGGDGELWGKIEWCDVVHSISKGSAIVHCSSVTL
ncbi:SKP1 interacting partner 6 family protein [Tripterygium wilfordii]|uniref:SKP1 interacting partner 6 family protein n=1 Tax=Tripterygium wilfordii TaxID=458696 RepID=A0A7J7DU84_TRIWF|nr:F-box/kelch-repeat protein SKIP6 [Tripterygium wilfordii]KAF5749925.1 SKP1 interacting partner 6 family protein [Tripterygium wilfordii]